MIIDAQLHEPTVELEWPEAAELRRLLLTELQLGYMRAVGVDAAILFPVDLDWGLQAAAEWPDRFGVVPMIMSGGFRHGLDPAAADIGERMIELFSRPGVVGFRAMIVVAPAAVLDGVPSSSIPSGGELVRDGLFDSVFATAEEHGMPLFVSVSAEPSVVHDIAPRYRGPEADRGPPRHPAAAELRPR